VVHLESVPSHTPRSWQGNHPFRRRFARRAALHKNHRYRYGASPRRSRRHPPRFSEACGVPCEPFRRARSASREVWLPCHWGV